MDKREDLRSMLQYLPLVFQSSSSLVWPPSVEQELQTMSTGPGESMVNSGEALALRITTMRQSISLNASDLAPYASQGYALFFDEKISRQESAKFFDEVVPALCGLLLKLPSMLEMHYQKADYVLDGVKSGLRLLAPQEAGVVFLSQELIAAILACSFCLFPEVDRRLKHLQGINFDELFSYVGSYSLQVSVYTSVHETREQDNDICQCMPKGFVSFERKVITLEYNPHYVSYPEAEYWAKSITPLCYVEVHTTGIIEDQPGEALEVEFADEYFGGRTLQIRFMMNPELIAGMLFLPRMDGNEAIEIVGAARFTLYTGFGSSFQFAGDYTDNMELDSYMRRRTRVVAIDAMPRPGRRQYKPDGLLRRLTRLLLDTSLASHVVECSEKWCLDDHEEEEKIGVATGNWGCGVFGGDPEVKIMLQWLAISQVCFFVFSWKKTVITLLEDPSCHTNGLQALQNVNQVVERISLEEMNVGELWSKLVEYSAERFSRRTKLGFFSWLITSLSLPPIE
ncbi:hypothetical protein Bca52824_028445 [Brassica carinata]|uniref:poly(ADP-ribose) glycohydrolase n=1 Tax=Brassica carinata TaxID=52824 RepID=A0A8X8ARN9_BRACI|nr:hypothetical protein Bca52824_028445 [Brassica carinata]